MPSAKGAKHSLRLEWIEAGSLTDNPDNWRRHPEHQRAALKALIGDPEVGWAGACLYNEKTGRLIDGHARKESVPPGTPIPVLVGAWSEMGEKKILATLDPLAAMAEASPDKLEQLLAEVKFDSPAVDDMLRQLADSAGAGDEEDGATALIQLDTKAPPKMAWVLVGIPVVRFGEIADQVEKIAALDGVVCETVANDG